MPQAVPGVIDRAVYGTIVVTSVLVIYDGWANLKVLGAIAVILGPLVATVIGHVFAASLAAYPNLGRSPRGRELLRIVRRESRFLPVCTPQIVLLLILKLAGLSLNDSVSVVIWVSAASLGFWGGLAAQRAGLRGRGIALGVIAGLAAGGTVLLLPGPPPARHRRSLTALPRANPIRPLAAARPQHTS